MALAAINMADAVVLLVIAAIVALIVRGMLKGTVTTCDPGSCSGSCGSCGSKCATPRIKLSSDQLEQLHKLDEQARGAS